MKKTVASIRTISPGSPPDIDTDFSDEIRGKVVEHLIELYGQDKVAHIATYNTYAGKGAVKKACSIYGMPMSASAKLAASIPDNISWPKGIINGFLDSDSDIYKAGEEFRELTSDTDTWGKVVECARELEGRVVSSGHHPCGVVISAKPLGGITPVTEKDVDGVKTYVTQWEYPQLESMGLIKMDLLGLSTVTLISKTVANCLKSGVDPKLVDMESFIAGGLKDKETYNLFSRGETAGIFQFSNPAVREVCRNVKPTRVEEIADITALYRPGPMDADAHNVYWKTKHGQIDPTLPHPEFKGTVVEEILSRTNNVLVYQEQVMEIASRGCGMSLTEADKLRKAMGKKKLDVMNSMKGLFVEGGMRVMGVSEKAITTLWDVIVPFSGYAFNACLHGETVVRLADERRMRLRELYKRSMRGERFSILSMWPDGSVRPHTVANVSNQGMRDVFKLTTETGKTLVLTGNHRLLTVNGYGTIDGGELKVGAELIVDEKEYPVYVDSVREKRRQKMIAYNKSEQNRIKCRERMRAYQETLTYEDRCAHQQKIQRSNPHRTDNWLAACLESQKKLRDSNPEWVEAHRLASIEGKFKKNGRLMGRSITLTDGRVADSLPEALAAEYLLSRGVEFELHKRVENSKTGKARFCDFYVNGSYIEMDGLRRGREWFTEKKYGELPFVYLTPENYIDVLDEFLQGDSVSNGEKIVSIEPFGRKRVYDVEMTQDGPSNFLANGIVSHNSHAISYGINAVQAAYLKAHFPREFIAAALDMRYGNPKDARMLMTEARNMGIRVESVDVNRSSAGFAPDFTSHEPVVLFGLSGVSGITQAVGEKIVAERETNGPFTSVEDFLTRLRSIDERLCNKKLATSFALAGAFDSLGVSRKAVSEGFTQWSQSTRKVETLNSGFGLFDLDEVMPTESGAFDSKDDYSFTEKIALESSVSGLYLSQHPLTHIKQPLKLEAALKSKKTFTMKVAVFSVERKKSKGGGADRWTVVLDDGVSYCEASVSSEFAKAMATDQARAQVRRWWSKNDGSKLHPDIQKRALSPVSRAPLQAGRVYTVKVKVHPRGVVLMDAVPVVLDSEGREPETLFVPKWRSPDCGKLLDRLLPKFADQQSSTPFAALIATDPLVLFDPVEAYEKVLSGEVSDAKRSWSWESVFGRDAKVPYSEDDLYQALLYRPDVCELVETGGNCDSPAYAYYNNLTDKQRAWFERSLFEGDRVSFGRGRLE